MSAVRDGCSGGWVQGRMAINGGMAIGRDLAPSGGVAEDRG